MLQLGQWQLETVSGGTYRLDGGTMYGVVPKTVWHNVTPADEHNRLPFATNLVLARRPGHTVLIDTGYGGKLSRLDRGAHVCQDGDPVIESLAAIGLTAADITAVALTHLHWDHAGGATRFDSQRRPVPTFPNATYYVNRLEWEDATGGAPELAGSYFVENFVALEEAGQLALIDGDIEILPGLWTRHTGGHTRGHQGLLLESDGQVAIQPGDLCPVTALIRRMWVPAYDLYPVDTRRRRPQLLGEAADKGWWVLWGHDPAVAASHLERHKSREFVVTSPRDRL